MECVSKESWMQTCMSCLEIWTCINEEQLDLQIIFLIRMKRGAFQKKKPFCEGAAELAWRASLCDFYHKNMMEVSV